MVEERGPLDRGSRGAYAGQDVAPLQWSRGAIVGFTCFWVLWVSWAWWQAEGWPYRWLYVPLLVLILMNGWWRWKLDVTEGEGK